ncbi:MAG: hypothetical protein IJ064_07060 [Bacteroidaceae bacterium]|nr:hypothetical protein [Bacteroidaceae bacterium]
MSDGNFNRSLLPHTPYQSGLKAGKAMGNMHALKAFEDYLHQFHPNLDNEHFREQLEHFRRLLAARIR